MPSTYSTRLRIELPGIGEQNNTWGTTLNTDLGTLIEEAIAGVAAVTMTDADYTLVASNGSSDEARRAALQISGALTAARNVICPTQQKLYLVYNNTSGGFSITLKTAAGSGISISNGKKRFVYCDGTNVVDGITDLPSGTQIGGVDIVTLSASQTLTNKILTSPTINTPTISVVDGSFTVTGSGDATKKFVFEADGITTATTRTVTVPDANITLVGLTTTQTLQNKTLDNTNTVSLKDALFSIQDDGDATKIFQFQASGITTGNTRVGTIADANFTLGGVPVNAQTGTTYTMLATDRGKLVTFSNASAVAVTLPQATTTGFNANFYVYVRNVGAGTVTITPTTSTIGSGTAVVLRTGQWAIILSDNTNYECFTVGTITGAATAIGVGYRGVPVTTADIAYQFAFGDEGCTIRHTSASTHTYTIPSNAGTPFPVGTAITIVNEPGGGNITLSITTDTLNRGDGVAGTGSRTIAANSVATVIKTASTTWMITGSFT